MKKLTMLLSLLCLTAALAVPASALEYDIASPGDPEYGKPTSVELLPRRTVVSFPMWM